MCRRHRPHLVGPRVRIPGQPANPNGLGRRNTSVDPGQALGVRLARQDECALEDIYAAYGPALLTYLRRYVGPDEAEDVLQRTFLDVWRSAGRYEPEQRFSSWLFTIAHHRAVDTVRRRRATVVDVDTVRGLIGEDGRETAARYADAAEVRAALARLPDHERTVLQLAYYEDLTQREIATHLDVPLGTVKARASRGTHRLAGLITDETDIDEGHHER
ncbi:sigma-70 family RNA polymerase sigma factor [Aeromicrobium sp. SMF47]|nr:sigma-70 family RNA polymerase sigma factor [Aeromicrobium yanjiei]